MNPNPDSPHSSLEAWMREPKLKFALARSSRSARNWIEGNAGKGALFVKPMTLRLIADEILAGSPETSGKSVLTDLDARFIGLRIFRALREPYFQNSKTLRGIQNLALRTLNELRMAGWKRSDPIPLPNQAKARALSELLSRYEEELASRSLLDDAELYRLAASRLRSKPALISTVQIRNLEAPLGFGFEREFFELVRTHSDWLEHGPDQSPTSPSIRVLGFVTPVRTLRTILSDWLSGGVNLDAALIASLDYDPYSIHLLNECERLGIPLQLLHGLKADQLPSTVRILSLLHGTESDAGGATPGALDRLIGFEKALKSEFKVRDESSAILLASTRRLLGSYRDLTRSGSWSAQEEERILHWLEEDIRDLRLPAGDSERGIRYGKPLDFEHLALSEGAVLGLNDGRYPRPHRQDPILLDEERALLNGALPPDRPGLPMSAAPAPEDGSVERFLDRSTGRTFACFRSHSELEGNLELPSPILLRYLKTEQDNLTLNEILELTSVHPSVHETDHKKGFLPIAPESPDRAALLSFQTRSQALSEPAPGIHDGILGAGVQEEIKKAVLERPLSPSLLGTFFTCPYRFFLSRVLGVPEREDPEDLQATHWLDAAERGKLFHTVYERYFEELRDLGKSMLDQTSDQASARLQEIAKEEAEKLRVIHPPRIELIAEVEVNQILEDLEGFALAERAYFTEDPGRIFFAAEAAFGKTSTDPEVKAPGIPDPIELQAGPIRIGVRGKIDRIDHDGKGNYVIWDYKTGKSKKNLDSSALFLSDTAVNVQPAAYARALREIVKTHGLPNVRSISAGYYFSTRIGGYVRFKKDEEAFTEKFDSLLTVFGDAVSKGEFPRTKEEKNCTYCAYSHVCGSLTENRMNQIAKHRVLGSIDSILSGDES